MVDVPHKDLSIIAACADLGGMRRRPVDGVDTSLVSLDELGHGRAWVTDIKDKDRGGFHVKGGNEVRVVAVELEPQERVRCAGLGSVLLWLWRSFVEDGRVFKRAQIKKAHRSVSANAGEDVRRAMHERNIVYVAVVRNQLRLSLIGLYVPDRAGCVDTRGHDQ